MKKLMIVLLVTLSVKSFSQQVQRFSLTNVLDGKVVSQGDYASNAAIVIIFTVNACAFDDYYIDRIKALSAQYQNKVPVLLVNADQDGGESAENMIKRAQQKGITIPYLADKDQLLMRNLNARKSVEAFLLKNTNGNFGVVYRGAIDDNPQVAADVRHPFLKEAIDDVLAGRTIGTPEVRPVGCNIRTN